MDASRAGRALRIAALVLLALAPGCGESADEVVTEQDFETFEQWQARAEALPSQEDADRRAAESIRAGDVEQELERLREEILGRQ